MINPEISLNHSSLSALLINVDNSFNKKFNVDRYALQTYDTITELIFSDRIETTQPRRIMSPLPRLAEEEKPLINIVNEIAGILYSSKSTKKGNSKKVEHAELTAKIKDLEKLQADKIDTQSFTDNETVNGYCSILINECISSLKEKEKGKIEKNISSESFKKLGVNGKLTDEQYKLLREESNQLDKFFNNFEKFLGTSKKSENFFEQFHHVWTLTLDRFQIDRPNSLFLYNPKRDRAARIKTLEKSALNLPKGLAETPEAYNAVKANLNCMLAIAILAKEMDRGSPKKEAIDKAKQLLEESKEFSKPAELLLKTDFSNFKTFKPDPKEMKIRCKEILTAIQEAGCEKLVSKRDLKEVFKMIDPKAMKKDRIFHILKTIAAVLLLPIVWTTAALVALAFLIFGILFAFGGGGR